MKFIICALSLFLSGLAARPLHLEVYAKHAIVMNADTGAILYEKHARAPVYPASTTKIATALYVLDEKKIDLESVVTVSTEALRMKTGKNRSEAPPHWLESDGSMMGLIRGEILTMESLLHGLLLVSGNDAANVIAEAVSGSVPVFVEELNEYLKRIGCKDTIFYTPHGYHHPEHLTTAYDLCLMARRALQNPAFCEIVSKESYIKPQTNKKQQVKLEQSNKLLVKGSKYYYPKAIGIKTGYYGLAGNNLVAAATDNGRTLIAVVLGSEKRGFRFVDAKNLFEAAFAEQPEERLLVSAFQTYEKKIPGAKKDLVAILPRDFVYSYYPAEEPEIKAFVEWGSLSLPIRKGQQVAEIAAYDQNNQKLASIPLFAKEEVQGTFFFALKEKMSRLFQ